MERAALEEREQEERRVRETRNSGGDVQPLVENSSD